MRVKSIQPAVNGLPPLIEVAPTRKPRSNWITIFTGQNGSCKSVILRTLLAATFKHRVFPINKERPQVAFLEMHAPPRVIALSGTSNNRFPSSAGIPIARGQTEYDNLPYRHFGPQGASSVSTRSRAAAEIVHSLICDPERTFARRKQIAEILGKLGYADSLRVKFSRQLPNDRYQDLLRQQIRRTLDRLRNEAGTERGSLHSFLSRLLSDESMQQEFLSYFSEPHSLAINLQEQDSLKVENNPFSLTLPLFSESHS